MNQSLKTALAALAIFLAPLLALGCAGGSARVPTYAVETLQKSGDPANRINLVVLGDGYTQTDQAKLTQDAQAWLTAFLGTPPYQNYAGYFNVKLVHVVSNEDGADNGMHGFGVLRDTALGAAYQNANPPGLPPDYRLLVVNNATAQAVAMSHAPECTKAIVIVNDSKYGGSGGALPVFSANPSSCLIALHEFGHSFGGLADEYACGDTSALPTSLEAFPNVTTQQSPDLIKWNRWIQVGTPLPTPDVGTDEAYLGLFEGAFFHDRGVYRPRHACRMRSLNDAFCEVCTEAIVRGVYSQVSPIDSASPSSPVMLAAGAALTCSIAHPVPNPNTLQMTWTVDGVVVAGDGDSFTLPGGGLDPGVHEISAQLIDATPLVRLGRESLAGVQTWTVTVGGTATPAIQPAPKRDQHLLLRVTRDAAGFHVEDRQIIDLPLPLAPSQGSTTWQIEAQDPDGQVLFGQDVEDPTLLRGEFQNAANPGQIEGYRMNGGRPASFLLRMPVMNAHRLEIFAGPGGQDGLRTRLGGVALSSGSTP
ncbi:MAG TPA: M64 family metallopeptidase [Geothrix sp.]